VTENCAQDREDRRKHLDFIQSAINRMSASSSNAKAWLLPVVTASYGYALTQGADSIAVLGTGATLLFAYLDTQYLHQEKQFRELYRAVASGQKDIPVYSMDYKLVASAVPTDNDGGWKEAICTLSTKIHSWLRSGNSWSIKMFYLPITFVGILIAWHVN